MTRPIRVLIADDHRIVREGLLSMLRGARAIEIVGQASSGAEAIQLSGRLQPDVVLLDIRMPDIDGLTAVGEIRRRQPDASIVFLTMFGDLAFLRRAVEAGAAGYLLKGVEREALIKAIIDVRNGESVFDPALLPNLLNAGQFERNGTHPSARLTARELDVLSEIAEGRTNLEISASLGISLETVKTHVQRVIAKLGAADRTQAAVLAVTRGLVTPSPPA